MKTAKKNRKPVVIYTDGSCYPNPGPGGWGAILIYGSISKEIYGGEPYTTNNRMEMLAAIYALEKLKRRCGVVLYTDSQYLQRGATEWMPGWKAKGWRNIKNADLWKWIDKLNKRHQITWRWIRGHSDDVMNDRADQLALKGRLWATPLT